MSQVKRPVFQLMLVALAVLLTALPAQAKWKKVPKVDNVIFFQDYSGSMAMHMEGFKDNKIVMSKNLLTELSGQIPELGYKASLHTFAPFSEMMAMDTYSAANLSAAVGKLESDYEIFQRLTPMGNGMADLRPTGAGHSVWQDRHRAAV